MLISYCCSTSQEDKETEMQTGAAETRRCRNGAIYLLSLQLAFVTMATLANYTPLGGHPHYYRNARLNGYHKGGAFSAAATITPPPPHRHRHSLCRRLQLFQHRSLRHRHLISELQLFHHQSALYQPVGERFYAVPTTKTPTKFLTSTVWSAT
jgi:hypothetical protein